MKKILLLLLCLPFFGFGQQTYVPDDVFETHLEYWGMGNGLPNDNYVTTANISSVGTLCFYNENISDFTGLEDFISLDTLIIHNSAY